jgi:murein tripeptide amidase MpaA
MVKMKVKKHIFVILIALAVYSLTLEALPKRIANVYPLPKSYYNSKKLNTDLSNWSQNNPGLVKLHSLGKTANDKNTLYAMQIQNGIDRIPVLIVGQHHGDEVLGIEIAMSFADKLINSKGNANIEQLLDKYSFWIIPSLNPDGWKVVTTGKY